MKWADFRLDALLADTMLTKLYLYNRAIVYYKVTHAFVYIYFIS
jgi:hypothetical protein